MEWNRTKILKLVDRNRNRSTRTGLTTDNPRLNAGLRVYQDQLEELKADAQKLGIKHIDLINALIEDYLEQRKQLNRDRGNW
jgi:hypothetical protein